MKNVAFIAIAAGTVLAAYPRVAAAADNKENPKGSLSEAIPDTRGTPGLYVSAGLGPAFYTGSAGWGVNASALIPVLKGTGLYVGAELGATFWSYSSPAGTLNPTSASSTALALTPTAIYRLDMWEAVHPYIGASIGPAFYTQDSNGVRSNKLLMQFVARPGIFTALSDKISLQAEAKLGILGGDFLFNPHANISFAL